MFVIMIRKTYPIIKSFFKFLLIKHIVCANWIQNKTRTGYVS